MTSKEKMQSGNQELEKSVEEVNLNDSDANFFLASIVESSQDSIITIDFNEKITSWNKGAERLYGYPANEALGKSLLMLTLSEDLQEVLSNVERIKTSQKVEIFNTVRLNKDGQQMHLEIMLSPVKNETGQVVGVSTIARDITERIQMEAAFKEADRRKDEFLATLAHELR